MRNNEKELCSYKSNEMIQKYAWPFSEKQLKIMELLCSCFRTNYYDENRNAITINLVAFMNEVGISRQNGGWAYQSLALELKALSDASIIGVGYNEKFRIIRLINSVDFPTKSGDTDIVCYMSDDFKACMEEHPKGNTSVLLRTIYNFNSKYSIKLYNLLRSWDGKSEASFFFTYFRSILSADAKSYHNITKFRAKVLDSSVREINEKTELTVSYEVKKRQIRGKKEPVFLFTIQKKKVDSQDKDKTPIPARAPDIPVKKQQV